MKAIRDQLLRFFKLDPTVVRAKGGNLWLEDGSKVYDFLSQYGANPFGANDRYLVQGIKQFLSDEKPMLCQPFKCEEVQTLKQRLLTLSNLHHGDMQLCQSGAEAVELSIKIARAATQNKYTIALEHGFHGKTTGSVQLTGNPEYREFFGVPNEFVRRLSTDLDRDLDADFAKLTADSKVNAVILELVQGEGGMRVLDKRWVQRLVSLARKKGILIIADEVQTGLGRTGTWFAHQQYGINPDMLLLAKALGGGVVPIGACITAPDLCPQEFTLYHSSTFANNNFTCSVANRVLDRLEDGVLESALSNGHYLASRLDELVTAYPDIYSAASGLGLMRGIHLHPQQDKRSYVSNLFWHSGLTSYAAAGWLLRTQQMVTMPCFSSPSCLRLQPPLTSTRRHIDRGIDGLHNLAGLLRTDIGAVSLLDTGFDSNADDFACFGRFSPESDHRYVSKTARGGVNQTQADKYAGPQLFALRSRSAKATRRFQFAIHPLHDRTCLASLPFATDTLLPCEQERLGECVSELMSVTRGTSAPCLDIEAFKLGDQIIEGRLFALNMTAANIMQAGTLERKLALKALASSTREYKPDVFGLGAFTSIIAKGGFLLRELPQTITTGSSLTAFAAVQSALATPVISRPQHFGVIGANGGVGALCWQMLFCAAAGSSKVRGLSLFYNPQNPNAIRELANSLKRAVADWQLRKGDKSEDVLLRDTAHAFRICVGSLGKSSPQHIVAAFRRAVDISLGQDFLHICAADDARQLQKLDRVLVATNRVDGVKELHETSPGAVLYDIGYPLSFDPQAMAAEGKSSYSAGLVDCPGPWEFGRSNIADIPSGMSLACFAETMILAATDPLAAPRGARIKLGEAQRIGDLALSVGFKPGVVVAGCSSHVAKGHSERLVAV